LVAEAEYLPHIVIAGTDGVLGSQETGGAGDHLIIDQSCGFEFSVGISRTVATDLVSGSTELLGEYLKEGGDARHVSRRRVEIDGAVNGAALRLIALLGAMQGIVGIPLAGRGIEITDVVIRPFADDRHRYAGGKDGVVSGPPICFQLWTLPEGSS